jgi:acyl-CoA thioester hydrolase
VTPPDLTDRRLYPWWEKERIRFGDTDAYGHANNAVFVTVAETGRIHFLARSGLPALDPETHWVIVRLVLDFRGEMHWPDEIDIGTAVLKVGRSSVTLIQGMFHGDHCVATDESVLVLLDRATRRATPLPETLRRAFVDRAIPPD